MAELTILFVVPLAVWCAWRMARVPGPDEYDRSRWVPPPKTPSPHLTATGVEEKK